MIEALSDPRAFRARRQQAWSANVDYWLTQPLRHVADVGDRIVTSLAMRIAQFRQPPTILDMGFGSAWLLRALLQTNSSFSYVGLDICEAFVARARQEFASLGAARFEVADFETADCGDYSADIVVNAFNFFELASLTMGMRHASAYLRAGGLLSAWTIDKTYLILALSSDWEDFLRNLALYERLPGTKFGFQAIDLGSGPSSDLQYPSVLYSAGDFVAAAREQGLHLRDYAEFPFTAKPVPKIYCQLEFGEGAIDCG